MLTIHRTDVSRIICYWHIVPKKEIFHRAKSSMVYTSRCAGIVDPFWQKKLFAIHQYDIISD